ncbi:DEAD/DEAH box helicase [soil metagenome]
MSVWRSAQAAGSTATRDSLEGPTVSSVRSFAALGVPEKLSAVLQREGIDAPFPIQTATLPDTLAGRDVLGRGRTGSGKTLAFALPLVARLAGHRSQPSRPRGLVLAPTRELVSQIAAVVEPLAAACGLKVATVYGGVSQSRQVTALRAAADIVIGCPGRLEDLIRQGHLRLDAVEISVLDEADYMADLGFLPAVRRLLDATQRHGQRMLFSATLDNGVDVLVRRYLTDALTHSVDAVATPIEPTSHHVLAVDTVEDKNAVVHELASGEGRRLLFTRTKHQAKRLARQLTVAGIPAVDLHGNLNQNARDRNLAQFATGQVSVLVATDVAARGIHVDDVRLVVHVDPPAEHKAYLHRSGRTARAGATGDVVTVMLPGQRGDVRTLARQAGITPVIQPTRPGSAHTRQLVGPAMPLRAVTMAPVAPTTSGRRKASPAGAGRRNSQLATTEAGSRHRGSPKAPGTGGRRRGTPLVAWTSNSGGAAAFSSSSRSGGRRAGR